MKKIYYQLSIMLILLMTMSSCSGDDAKSNGDIPIPSEGDVSDEIAAFLKSHYVLDSEYEAFFAHCPSPLMVTGSGRSAGGRLPELISMAWAMAGT